MVVLFVMAVIMANSAPECKMPGCDNDAYEDSRYCFLHDLSYRTYGNPDYNAIYAENVKNRENTTTATTEGATSAPSKKKPSFSFSSDSYDEGYDDVMEEGDYDWDRYFEDDDYASGVDDALDELDE